MLDLAHAAPSGSLVGRLLRAPLRLIPHGTVVPVLTGPLRGARWVVGVGLYGCWLGTYEADKQRTLASHVPAGAVFYDIGANVGLYTLLAARRVGPSGRVYAFEPSPRNIGSLRRHVELNNCRNVDVRACALADAPGIATFVDDDSYTGRLSSTGRVQVVVETLDQLIAAGRIEPARVVKIDVEGAELSVLRGGAAFFSRSRPVIFLATHGAQARRECRALLQSWGYRLSQLDHGDADTSDEILAVIE